MRLVKIRHFFHSKVELFFDRIWDRIYEKFFCPKGFTAGMTTAIYHLNCPLCNEEKWKVKK